jgi:hypothetical protein
MVSGECRKRIIAVWVVIRLRLSFVPKGQDEPAPDKQG